MRNRVGVLALLLPNCANGRVVADVMRIDKGHTEGLEPEVTEALARLIVSARGGKLRGQSSGEVIGCVARSPF